MTDPRKWHLLYCNVDERTCIGGMLGGGNAAGAGDGAGVAVVAWLADMGGIGLALPPKPIDPLLSGKPVCGKSVFRGTVGLGVVVAAWAGVDAKTTDPPSEPCNQKKYSHYWHCLSKHKLKLDKRTISNDSKMTANPTTDWNPLRFIFSWKLASSGDPMQMIRVEHIFKLIAENRLRILWANVLHIKMVRHSRWQ